MKLVTVDELRGMFSAEDDRDSIMVCLVTLFEDGDETVVLVDDNLHRIDVDYEELADNIYVRPVLRIDPDWKDKAVTLDDGTGYIPWKWRSDNLHEITRLMKNLSDMEMEFMDTLVCLVRKNRELERSLPKES